MPYKAKNRIIKFHDDYSVMASEAKNQVKKGTLTPKQMFQRLPIVLAQVKAGSNSEGLWNEIRQIVSNKITEKVYNNIIKSIQI